MDSNQEVPSHNSYGQLCRILVSCLCCLASGWGDSNTERSLYTSDITKYMHLLEFLFCDNYTAPAAVEGVKGTSVKKLFVNGMHPGCLLVAFLLTPSRMTDNKLHDVTSNDEALIMLSSGTTGFPNGVVMTHYSISKWFRAFRLKEAGLNSGNCSLVFQPMSHVYGIAISIISLLTAKPIILMARFDMDEYLKCVVKYKITSLHFVPPLAVMFTKGRFTEKYDLSHVTEIFCGATPLSNDVINDLTEQMGNKLEMKQLYAMTESPGTYSPPKRNVPNVPIHSVGLPYPGTKITIVDLDTGTAVGPMTRGEVCILSDFRMKEYLKNTKATKYIIDETGWLQTGDIGYYDKVGHIFIVDRLKELIKYKGLQSSSVVQTQ